MNKHIFSFFLIATLPFLANAQSYSSGSTLQSRPYQNSFPFTAPTQPNVRYQKGYLKSDGAYIEGHYKTQPNDTNSDNFSTSGNLNPYTRQSGNRARDYSPEAQNYGSGRMIHTGPRGGQYYINGNGNKTYVPKRLNTYSPF